MESKIKGLNYIVILIISILLLIYPIYSLVYEHRWQSVILMLILIAFASISVIKIVKTGKSK